MTNQIAPTAPHRSSSDRFARDFPTLDAAAQLTRGFIAHPSIYGVVAEIDGRSR